MFQTSFPDCPKANEGQPSNLLFSLFFWPAVHSDADVAKYKGKVVLDYEERKSVLPHIKWIDEIVENAPWWPTLDWMQQHNIDFVIGDEHMYDQYQAAPFAPVREAGRFISVAREEGSFLSVLSSSVHPPFGANQYSH